MTTSIIKKEIKEEMKRENIRHNIGRLLLTVALVAAPITTFAYTQSLSDLSILAVKYLNQAIYVIIAIAIVVFVWNIFNYFFRADVENKKEAGLYVMYSVIGFFVIIAFWGLVNIVSNTLNLNTNAPSLNFFGSSINRNSVDTLSGPSQSDVDTETGVLPSDMGNDTNVEPGISQPPIPPAQSTP